MNLLNGLKVINIAVNLPGPLAARRLFQLGADIVKVEPPSGDPINHPDFTWYGEINKGHEIITLDLKSELDLKRLNKLFEEADLLISAQRPAAMERLGLGWDVLHSRFPKLCQVAIVGYPPPFENQPGHDLTYQAQIGLVDPPRMPKTLIADLIGAERAVSMALALLHAREETKEGGYALVALSDGADYMAEPFTNGFTSQGAVLGGGLPEYNLYESTDGWVAVAAVEPHFKARLYQALDLVAGSHDILKSVFKTRSAREWEEWAKNLDLPIVKVNKIICK